MNAARTRLILRYIGANVRRARNRQAWTQEALAEKSEIDPRYLQSVERGKANLTIAFLVALADALGVEERALLREAELPPARPGRPPVKKGPRAKRQRP